MLSLSAQKHSVTIKAQGIPSPVLAEHSLLTELIYNLCDNAIRYNKKNGTVDIIVSDQKVIVKDSGIGIPLKHQERIFERFYRIDKSRSKETGGTGLGLAIVKHIAMQLGANVELVSEQDIGTQITIIFA